MKSISSKKDSGKAENPKKLGHYWQRAFKGFHVQRGETSHPPSVLIIRNDNMLQARRSLETAGFYSGSFPQ